MRCVVHSQDRVASLSTSATSERSMRPLRCLSAAQTVMLPGTAPLSGNQKLHLALYGRLSRLLEELSFKGSDNMSAMVSTNTPFFAPAVKPSGNLDTVKEVADDSMYSSCNAT